MPVGVTSELIRGDVFFWGPLMAGALLGSIRSRSSTPSSSITSPGSTASRGLTRWRGLMALEQDVRWGDVVKDVNLEIRDKEFAVLVGPSGSARRRPCAWWPGSN